ncbi:antitoxin [Aldersonia sp. NBC_00410]|uniref:antitoxin n=1 Tax=Aldersonia sp. NBC_00410 TaxID=2975954 RepID=UPI0022572503|nr:antitoxin [Aldersonia sp. NBC_00410]MCX5045655.1 antitoxin [Aldersonia sp. NBC_00410]
MTVFDQLKGLLDKGKKAAAEHKDQIDSTIDKVGDTVDKQTKGKYSDKVGKAKDAAKKAINE